MTTPTPRPPINLRRAVANLAGACILTSLALTEGDEQRRRQAKTRLLGRALGLVVALMNDPEADPDQWEAVDDQQP